MEPSCDTERPLFTAVSSSARQLFQLLKCINFASKAQVVISKEGLRFTVEDSRVMQGEFHQFILCVYPKLRDICQVLLFWKNPYSRPIFIPLASIQTMEKKPRLQRSKSHFLLSWKPSRYSASKTSKIDGPPVTPRTHAPRDFHPEMKRPKTDPSA